ncbi:MAG TPA: hypothetical protein VIV58_26155 [Kofleriaceae bacterium]
MTNEYGSVMVILVDGLYRQVKYADQRIGVLGEMLAEFGLTIDDDLVLDTDGEYVYRFERIASDGVLVYRRVIS